jgi:hypothetical protein
MELRRVVARPDQHKDPSKKTWTASINSRELGGRRPPTATPYNSLSLIILHWRI